MRLEERFVMDDYHLLSLGDGQKRRPIFDKKSLQTVTKALFTLTDNLTFMVNSTSKTCVRAD